MDEIKYKIIRSERRTTAIYINNDGSVEVRCNFKEKEKRIDDFVNEKRKFILKHLEKINKFENKKLNPGDYTYFLGKRYLIEKTEYSPFFDGEKFYVNSDTYKSLEIIYKNLAGKILPKIVEEKSKITNLHPTKISINKASKRWGSCNYKDGLNFTYKIMLLPTEIIDYIVVHELCHIKEKNHGKGFWTLVEKYEPLYKIKQKELRNYEILANSIGFN